MSDLLFSILLLIVGIVIGYSISYFLSKKKEEEICEKENNIVELIEEPEKDIIDNLTSLPNRKEFLKNLEEATAIILIDIDDFFIINSVYSKEIGDEILKKFANRITSLEQINPNEVYRIGGDEFAILFYEDVDLKQIADSIIKMVNRFYLLKEGLSIQITITIGISTKKPLLETAYSALKYAKRRKENITFYSEKLIVDNNYQYFVTIINRIKEAVKYNNVVPFFQCIKDRDGNRVSYEALMRIKEGNKYITPDTFLKVAKDTKLYANLSKKMIENTFKMMENKKIPFSINLLYEDMSNLLVREILFEKIDNFPIKQNIIIEISEDDIIKHTKEIQYFIEVLRKKGVKIAIDNFAAQYGNFKILDNIKPDFIKIDGSIISSVFNDFNSEFVIKSIVKFCKNNNCKSIAEYVFHVELYKELLKLDIDEFQGFYFCEPEKEIK